MENSNLAAMPVSLQAKGESAYEEAKKNAINLELGGQEYEGIR